MSIPKTSASASNIINRFSSLKKMPAVLEFRVIKKDGSTRWHASNGSPFYDKSGDVSHIFGISRDITARKETEQKLRNHMDGLKNSIESKDRYFSLLAHDLRSPFHIFLNLSELLSDGIDLLSKSEIIKLSKQLNIALHKQYELLTDLLDWSGIESNQLAFNPETLLLYEEVMKVFESVSSPRPGKRYYMLSCDSRTEILRCIADPRVLRTLIRNLLSNAIKFTNNGGWVKDKRPPTKANLEQKLSVMDNGVGMDSKVAENLLQIRFPHLQLREPTMRKVPVWVSVSANRQSKNTTAQYEWKVNPDIRAAPS
jgi:signal transduction histidine kinase